MSGRETPTEMTGGRETPPEVPVFAPIAEFLSACSGRLVARVNDPAAATGAAAFARALSASTPLEFEPRTVEALQTLPLVDTDGLGAAFVDVAPRLRWVPTFRADDGGVDLALAPLELTRDLGGFVAGVMYVGPGKQYPLHAHPPHEVYLTIAGDAEWRWGGHDDFRTVGPDVTLYNHPGDVHSVIAGATPLVAFYMQWTDDLVA